VSHIWWQLGEGLSVAGHGFAFALVDVCEDALLMHGGQLVLLSVALLLECLNRGLKGRKEKNLAYFHLVLRSSLSIMYYLESGRHLLLKTLS
jgi:hypothetical protein